MAKVSSQDLTSLQNAVTAAKAPDAGSSEQQAYYAALSSSLANAGGDPAKDRVCLTCGEIFQKQRVVCPVCTPKRPGGPA